MIAIGYWFNDAAPSAYPRPQRLVGRWPAATQRRVVAHLRGGALFERYGGSSFCRFACGIGRAAMGRRDRFDGAYVWPEGLAHYVEAHGVQLPDGFVAHALAPSGLMPRRPRERRGLVDDAPWIAWGIARGAVLDLAGWEAPSWAGAHDLAAKLARAMPPEHPLARRRTELVLARTRGAQAIAGDAVLRLRDGTLAVVALRRGLPTAWLPGWDAWPARTRHRR